MFERDQYYYHPDHLGSSSYVTDLDGEIFQHLEYFPFGETWVEEHSNTQRTPYLFTAKELDEETGLYYFGARDYDPRTSVWQSSDPILGAYLAGAPNGGAYQPINMSLYAYARQNPVGFSDSNGQFWGAASKLLKLAIKGGDVAATFAGVVEDTSTLFSSDATFGERLLAAGSLATEIVSPVSARDVKAGINAVEAGAKRSSDVRTLGRTGDGGQVVHRGDGRAPDQIFEDGFQPRDPDGNLTIQEHVMGEPGSQYVSTSKDLRVATDEFAVPNADDNGLAYVYDIDRPANGVDVNEVFPDNPLRHEQEIAVPGGVDSSCIIGCQIVDTSGNKVGDFIPNPNYRGGIE